MAVATTASSVSSVTEAEAAARTSAGAVAEAAVAGTWVETSNLNKKSQLQMNTGVQRERDKRW